VTPLVSVVMPCRNAGRMLRPALQSVIDQTHPALHIVFVDNASTDGSAAVAREVLAAGNRPFELTECATPGANRARNHGYQFVRGDYVQWMDADDGMDRDKIALQVAALDTNPRDDIAYGDWSAHRITPGAPDRIERFALRQQDDQALRTLGGVWYPPHLYLLRRAAADLLQAEQAWWPTRTVATDVEYSVIAALLGFRFRHVAGAHVRYNVWSDGQISKATEQTTRNANLASIYARLQMLVAQGRARVPLNAKHLLLLNQPWDVVFIPKGSAHLIPQSGRRVVLRRRDGREIVLRPREAEITRHMLAAVRPGTMFHYALILGRVMPELAEDQVTIIETLERLKREGFLETVPVGPSDAIE
jgi:Glycosyl transferase family 2